MSGKRKTGIFYGDYEKRKDTLSKKEQDTQKDMKIVQEMYARGFEFVPIDLYKANAHTFQIVDGKLMPALDTIEGLGDVPPTPWCLRQKMESFYQKMISETVPKSARR